MISYIPIIMMSWLKIIKIQKKLKKSIMHAAVFYCMYRDVFDDDILTNAEFISHYFPNDTLPDDKKRFEFAEALIKKYAKASLVVTSRLHCALPCLGLETPVIFMPSNIKDERFSGLKELLRVMVFGKHGFETEDEILKNVNGKISRKTKIENKREYIVIKEALEKECMEFMNN
jgi:polysaccharide pyruvyl transferase WcaK-like protein